MITFAICDDNVLFANYISEIIFKYCAFCLPERIEPQIAPIFTSAQSVLDYISINTIDVIFLDIEMPNINGFELAEKLHTISPETMIIFISAYENFVYGSFEYNPFRFIRKSHIEDELPICLEKVVEKCIFEKEILELKTVSGDEFVRVKCIVYFEGIKNYYIVHTNNKQYKCRGTMDSVEKLVESFDFFRVHAAYIVNLNSINFFDPNGIITMNNGSTISVSARRLTRFKKSYSNFVRKRVIK